MKIPEKPATVSPVSPGVVSDVQDVRDSGPAARKEGKERVELDVSTQSIELAARIREGSMTPVQAVQTLVESIVRRYPEAEGNASMKDVLLEHLLLDPHLRRLAATLGVDGQALAELVDQAGGKAAK